MKIKKAVFILIGKINWRRLFMWNQEFYWIFLQGRI